eukprot:5008587-Pleurochrysis_carterae.AAC.1
MYFPRYPLFWPPQDCPSVLFRGLAKPAVRRLWLARGEAGARALWACHPLRVRACAARVAPPRQAHSRLC